MARGEKKLGRGKGRRAKTEGVFPFCGAIVALFSLQPLQRFPFVSIRGIRALGGILFRFFFFLFFLVGVLKLLVDGNKCCISLLFLDVIELFEFLLQIFEDEYYSILYNIDTIFKILG